jgi:hypothetical protein
MQISWLRALTESLLNQCACAAVAWRNDEPVAEAIARETGEWSSVNFLPSKSRRAG